MLLALGLAGVAEAQWHQRQAEVMGTRVGVELWHRDADEADAAMAAVMREMRRIDALMSPSEPASEVALLNRRAAQAPVSVSDELFELLQRAQAISKLTGGAFDITYASVGRHYDYRQGERPSDATIREKRALIDYRAVVLSGEAHQVHFDQAGVRINLGGIAKGYAVDRSVELLREHGIEHAAVHAGGDSRLLGDRRGRPWMVAVQDPRQADEQAVVLPLADTAVSTSGDYERFFMEDGVRYHHIIDPSTGDASRGVQSVTVLGPKAGTTDALATAVFVMGAGEGLRLIDARSGYEAVIVDAERRLRYSEGLGPPD